MKRILNGIVRLSIACMIYAVIAGTLEFNPTDIDWFNTKLLCGSIITFLLTVK